MISIKSLRSATALLILLNILIFIAIRVSSAIAGDVWISMFTLPDSWRALAHSPWSLMTYMFAQYDVWHLLFNMLWLWWTGRLLATLHGDRSLVTVYLAGGFAGALTFLIYGMLSPTAGYLTGSSCSVLAVMTCAAVTGPSHRLNLLFFGSVKLIWVVAVSLLLYLADTDFSAPAAALAHLGGVLSGVVAGLLLRLPARRKTSHKTPREPLLADPDDNLILDGLLDKIRRSGYTSLTPAERSLLIDITKRIGK
ncbi:MAG: rhomboid family intramembrane serine protease [Muribaculaceae bacterium]|nr:rhomboid family intramembrane serine protease [Muribaculaceae bacterium]